MGRVIRDSVKTWTADQIAQVIETGLVHLAGSDRDVALSIITEFKDRGAIGRTGRRAAAMLVNKLAKRVHKEVGSMSDTRKRASLRRGDPVVVVETYGNGRNTRELAATVRETTRHAAKVRFEDGTERMVHYKHILLKSEPAPPPPVEAPPPVEPRLTPERPPLRLVPPVEELVLDRDASLRDDGREADARRKAEEAMSKTPPTPPTPSTQRTRSKPVPVSEVPEPNVAFGELADVATSDSGARYSPTRIGPFVRAVRTARGEYQWKTGRIWGVEQTPQSLVSSIERSQRIPTDDELIAIAQWGCPFEWGGVDVTLEVLIAWRDRDLRDRERWHVERRKAGGKHSARTKQATRAAAGGAADVLCIYHDCPDARAQASSPEDATCPNCIARWEEAVAAVEVEAERERAAAEEQSRLEERREAPKSTTQSSDPPVRSALFRVDFWASGTKVRTIDLTPERWAMLLDLAAEE